MELGGVLLSVFVWRDGCSGVSGSGRALSGFWRRVALERHFLVILHRRTILRY